MPAMIWTPSMSVGIEALDMDHKMLFGLINQLDSAIASGEADEIVATIINGLLDYTEYHFGREEAMMRACDYAALDSHVAKHQNIGAALRHLRDAYVGGFGQGIERQLHDLMRDWITGHILDEDMKYAPAMKGRADELARVDEDHVRRLISPSTPG